jgi:hypothetical protein
MWHHFFNLLKHSAAMSSSALGYKPLGVAVSILAFILDAGLFLYLLFRHLGREEMRRQWVQGLKYATISTLCTGFLVIVVAWLAGMIATVYEDHQSLVTNNQRLIAETHDLNGKLNDAQDNAEKQCEKAKGDEIRHLKRQLTAVCYNPDRHLTVMEESELFTQLKMLRVEMEKQKQAPIFKFAGFNGDAETSRFVGKLLPIFQNAGWQWKPSIANPNSPGYKKIQIQMQTEQDEQEKWMLAHGLIDGIFVFDKNWPKGFGRSVAMDLSQVGLADWTQSNQEQVKELPHLDVLTVWVGYKPVLSR